VETGHLRSTPREQISILFEAGLQLFPRKVGEPCANLYSFARVFTKGN
ncbi:hypothetical protein A2U01_0111008, partial [Trifolium medium]|nr:hypothetical protein [Trifolium medium]